MFFIIFRGGSYVTLISSSSKAQNTVYFDEIHQNIIIFMLNMTHLLNVCQKHEKNEMDFFNQFNNINKHNTC